MTTNNSTQETGHFKRVPLALIIVVYVLAVLIVGWLSVVKNFALTLAGYLTLILVNIPDFLFYVAVIGLALRLIVTRHKLSRREFVIWGGSAVLLLALILAQAMVPTPPNEEGEVVDASIPLVHHFRDVGDVRWHYVASTNTEAEPIVFLHGVPASWFMWLKVMEALGREYYVIAIDLKGYGQSIPHEDTDIVENYSRAYAADEIITLLDDLGLDHFNLVTHDRGVTMTDHIAAKIPDRVLRYVRGQQILHIYTDRQQENVHDSFRNPGPAMLITHQAEWIVPIAFGRYRHFFSLADLKPMIREYNYAGIPNRVRKYFIVESMDDEVASRLGPDGLLARMTMPLLLLESAYDPNQPRYYYEGAEAVLPNAAFVDTYFIEAGHFWVEELPKTTTEVIQHFFHKTAPFVSARF